MRFTFRVQRHEADPTQDVITDARYLTFGCTSAIAASEALCMLIEQGKYTPIHALSITNEDIVEYLDGLPEQKIHCSVMGAEALEAAVFNWAQRRGVDLVKLGVDIHSDEQEEGRVVCKCFSLSEPYIKRKIKELNLRTIPDITGAIKAGGACMSCHHTPGGLQDLLNEVWSGPAPDNGLRVLTNPIPPVAPMPEKPAPRPEGGVALSPYQFAKQVEKAFEEYIRPMVQRDGGDVQIIDIKDNIVYCQLGGACANCAAADKTVKMLVERHLKEAVDEHIRVIQV